ncbi:hypothetical protein IE077_004198 [Cardiosporidium cionae]|uniref:Splicing factor YJU2 n=1 Tax=Cardiosporidium cionae TaxID=476202 RepID=A0ABQ7J622_9APIC|nr:hypothetical protein IE077_004198 [Cardiosporidium cionae]|eukprot:KAF8819451.1 hypothetical protein IE077_004198 [Cardiosporidium cionae]
MLMFSHAHGPKGPKQMHMRMMFPFTLSCSCCNEFTYVGTKFNSRVEKVQGDDYLGIAIWRFYGRCPNCRNEITFKTDPKNGDYVLEFGGTRTYDAAKDTEKAENALKVQKESDLADDKMKQVEAKTYNTQLELQTLEQLDEIRQMNKQLVDRNAAADTALKYLSEREIDSSVAINEDQAARVSEYEQEMNKFRQELAERDHAIAAEAETGIGYESPEEENCA